MASAKDIVLRPISAQVANALVRRVHYSGKVVNNSQLHIGVFLYGHLEGVMQFGPSLDKRKLQGMVEGTAWNGFIELNRLAFTDALPRNSESRALAIAMKMLRKHAPHLQWVVTFADATQCGDGTIYRAAGFVLTGIKRNTQIWEAPEAGPRFSRTSLTDGRSLGQQAKAQTLCRVTATKGRHIHSSMMRAVDVPGDPHGALAFTGGGSSMRKYIEAGFKPLPGYQLRYVYFLDPMARNRLTVPILSYDAIASAGAGMVRGKPRATSRDNAASASHAEQGGASPTVALQGAD